MSYTIEQLETLKAAIASGQTEVRYGDRTVKYRSLDEMVRIQKMMAAELNKARRPNRVVATFTKGLSR